jgi:hypothetical protein
MEAIKNNMEPELVVEGSEEAPVEAPKEEVPAEETPSTDTPTEEKPAEETPAEETPEEPTLYETPDGRQVTAEVLQKEWKENFLPEFTRKSQELADLKRDPKDINNPETKDEPKWKNPEYVPQNYAEVIEIAKAEAVADMQNSAQAEQERKDSIQEAVQTELTGLKEKDPKLDENELFQHANKYGFQNLTSAHTNMADMKKSAVDVEQRTVKNIKDREADPISTGTGGELPDPSGYDPTEMSQFDGAAEYLAHVKKGSN